MRKFPSMDDNVSPAQLARRVDRLCDRFEAACKRGRRPRLERYLSHVPATAQPELLRELLALELEYRTEKAEKPAPEEYHHRFPEHAELINGVFHERGQPLANSSYLLRKWAANRLVSQLRMLTLPSEEQHLNRPSALSLLARIVSRAAGGESGALGVAALAAGGLDPPTKLLQPGKGDSATPAETPDGENPVARVLGDYELLNLLGKGGMGVVFRARQRSVKRIVALKVIRSDQLEQLTSEERQEWFERFRREGQMAACLEHDHLVTIYEVGEAEGKPFYSMRYVEGQSLADLLRQGPLTNYRAALFLEQVARALHALHSLRGLVHRDLKPRNILVDADDRPFLTDFGLAKWSQSTHELTRYGACVGTPEYMAPEQTLNAAAANAASDIYSLGATLYDMLTGRPPFKAADVVETLRQVREEDPPSPRRLNPAVHRDLALICLKCLEKEPQKRYASAVDVAEELRRYCAGEPLRRTRPVGQAERVWRWCRRKPSQAANAGLAALVLMAVTALSISIPFVVQLKAARGEADRLAIRSALEGGQALCERGEIARGMFRWVNGLTRAPEENPGLQVALCANLAAYACKINTLKGCTDHPAPVQAMAFGPGGLTVVTSDFNTPLYIWEAATGKDIPLDPEPQTRLDAVAFSYDGRMLVTANNDGTAQLWDVANKQRLGPPLRHTKGLYSVAFAPDGSVLTGGEDGTAQFWDVVTRQRLGKPFEHPGKIHAVAVSPDGKTVATGSKDGTVRLWNSNTRELLCAPLKHGDEVRALAFSPNSRIVVTGSLDRTAQLWEVSTGKRLAGPLKHLNGIWAVAFSPDGRRVLTGSGDRTAQLWEADSGRPIGPPLRHTHFVAATLFNPDGTTIVTGGQDKTVRLWDAVRDEFRDRVLLHEGPVLSIAFSHDGKLVASGGYDNKVRLWDARTGQPTGKLLNHHSFIIAVAFSPDDQTLLTTSDDRTAQLWSVRTGQPLAKQPLTHAKGIVVGAFSPDGKIVLTASHDGTACLWKADNGERLPLPPLHHDQSILAAAFSPDGRTIATASMDGTAHLWDATTGEPRGEVLRHDPMPSDKEMLAREGWVHAVVFSPDGKMLLTGSEDHSARLWDAVTGKWLGLTFLHDKRIRSVAFSPDGKMVLTGSDDHSARLWDAATGRRIAILLQHQGPIRKVAFSPDGRFIATGSEDLTVRIWDASTGEASTYLQHEGWVWALAFSTDGQTLLTGSADNTARLWHLPAPVPGTAEQILLWTQVITGLKLDKRGTLQVLDAKSWQQCRADLERHGALLR